jgi:hypothetical protein
MRHRETTLSRLLIHWLAVRARRGAPDFDLRFSVKHGSERFTSGNGSNLCSNCTQHTVLRQPPVMDANPVHRVVRLPGSGSVLAVQRLRAFGGSPRCRYLLSSGRAIGPTIRWICLNESAVARMCTDVRRPISRTPRLGAASLSMARPWAWGRQWSTCWWSGRTRLPW